MFCLTLAAVLLFPSCAEKPVENEPANAKKTAPATADAGTGYISFRDVAAAILPAVVEIRVTDDTGMGSVFDFSPRESTGLGSGVLTAKEGSRYFAVTNNHVVSGSSDIMVVTNDGTEHTGTLLGADSRLDIAVVSFESPDKEFQIAPIGDSSLLQVGDWVLAAGNPFGFEFSITAGIVSAMGRIGPSGNISDFIQTDASINQGNSGGPLVNLRGEVIGINTWITTETGINVGLGFAMPINNVQKAISDIISGGVVKFGWLGVEIGDVSEDEAVALSFDQRNGVIIHGVFNNSPAEKGGIFPGDIVVAINGEKIIDYRHLSRKVGSIVAGENAEFVIYRGGEEMTLSLIISLRGTQVEIERAYNEMWPGFSVIQTEEGLTILDLTPLGIPRTAGMEQDDVILSINSNPVKNLMDFYRIMNDTEIKAFDFLLNRSGEEITIGLIRR